MDGGAPEDGSVPLVEGALVLNCPGCGTKVADGTSICPKCDYIIDASFLSAEPPPEGNDDEATSAAPDPRSAAPASRPARSGTTGQRTGVTSTGTRRVARGTGPRPAVSAKEAASARGAESGPPSRPGMRAVQKPASRPVPAVRRAPEPPLMEGPTDETEMEESEPRRPVPAHASPMHARPPAPSPHSTGGIVQPEEVMSDVRQFIGELTRSDKITFGGACLIAISCFLPWKETATEGEVLGLMSMGVGGLFGAAIIISAIFIRVRRTMPKLNPLVPWMVQLSLSFFCIIYSVVFMRLAFDSTEVPSVIGNQMIMNSSPSFGVFLALLGALVALVGSLLGLKERT